MKADLRLRRPRLRIALLALMTAASIGAFTAGPVASAGVGPNHCVDFDGTDLNELYHTNDSFAALECNELDFGSMWRPVGYWATGLAHDVIPPDYEPLGRTPAEDFLLKVESVRYVIGAGEDQEITTVVDRDDLFSDRTIVFDFEVIRFSARLPSLSLGTHIVDMFVTLSTEHWDGLGVEPGNHLPAGESLIRSTSVLVAKPSPEPQGPPPPENPKLRIELVWDTEADLDLHLLHPNGDWNESPWDCYWANRAPNWGVRGSSIDDPLLELDDVDGFGPEIISLQRLEQVSYTVGVLYFFDPSEAPTNATVRIWDEDQLVAELTTEIPEPRLFWTVASVSLDGRDISVTPIGVVEPLP